MGVKGEEAREKRVSRKMRGMQCGGDVDSFFLCEQKYKGVQEKTTMSTGNSVQHIPLVLKASVGKILFDASLV